MTRNNICILPWVSVAIMPDGNVYPCCMSMHGTAMGNVNESSLEEIWNSDVSRDIRKDFLADKRLDMCSECWKVEDKGSFHSTRLWANKNFKHHFSLLENTNDGKADMNLIYTDIRFSNKCNLMCFYCGSIISSKWEAFDKKVGRKTSPIPKIGKPENLLDSLINNISKVEQIYLSGGEPSIMEESYTMLEAIIDMGLSKNIKLLLNSNMSNVTYRGKNFWDILSKFKEVELAASIDEIEQRAEWIRYGEKWPNIVETNDYVKQYTNISVQYSPVVSMFNFHRLPEIITYWQDKGWITKNFHNVYLAEPGYGTSSDYRYMPMEWKQHVKKVVESFLEETQMHMKNIFLFNTANSLIKSMLEFDDEIKIVNNIKQVAEDISLHDRYRKVKFSDAFPELEFLNE